jgi:hypothetical protein
MIAHHHQAPQPVSWVLMSWVILQMDGMAKPRAKGINYRKTWSLTECMMLVFFTAF